MSFNTFVILSTCGGETWPSHRENKVAGALGSFHLLTCELRSDALRDRNELQTEESQPRHERDSFPCEIITPRFLGEIMWDLGVVVMLGMEGRRVCQD